MSWMKNVVWYFFCCPNPLLTDEIEATSMLRQMNLHVRLEQSGIISEVMRLESLAIPDTDSHLFAFFFTACSSFLIRSFILSIFLLTAWTFRLVAS